MWDEMLPFCQRTCALFPYLQLMGLDLTFTRTGLQVIEVEADPACIHQAYWGKGLRPFVQQLLRNRRNIPQR